MRKLFILLNILWGVSVYPQEIHFFNKLYSSDTIQGSTGIITIEEGYLAISPMNIGSSYASLLHKIAIDGEMEWTTVMDKGQEHISMSLGSCFIRCKDDDLLLVHKKSLINPYIDNGDIFIIKFKENGDIVWKKHHYNSTGRQVPNQVIQTKDGGFFIIGWHQKDTNNGYFYALKIDALGEFEWEGLYSLDDSAGHSAAFSTVQTADGGYFITGYGYHAETGYDMYIVKIDSLGNWLWEKNIDGGTGESEAACKIFDIGDNKYLLTGGIGKNYVLAYMAVVDTTMEVEWEETYKYDEFNVFHSNVVQNPNDQTYTTLAFSKHNGITHHHLYKIKAADGAVVWKRTFKTALQNDDYLRDLRPTPDGGFVAAGFVLSPSPQRSWVIKFDSLGKTCSYVGCDSVAYPVSAPLLDAPVPARCSVSPNPVGLGQPAYIHYHFPQEIPEVRFCLYDVRGVLVSEQRLSTLQNKVILKTKNFVSGIYLWEVVLGRAVLESGKVFVE